VIDISHTFTFEAAHDLPQAPVGHKCRRLHGHSYEVMLTVRGPVQQPAGWVIDFADIAAAWAPLHGMLDHQYLNEIEGLENPTSELLATWIWQRLVEKLPGLIAVEIAETCTCRCVYRGS
jgi:6-pyruvoyltetrahydropterin/6-carboxytetrahydropterin synthase